MYPQATATLAEATAQVDYAAAQLDVITGRVKAQLAELQNAVSDSKRCLQDAAATIAAIRPEEEF
jgi:ABC-type transporter Mla subunit MlaD